MGKPTLDLDRIIFIGRTFDEYISLFNLNEDQIKQFKILDCPAGACSFTAKSNQLGGDVTAVDIAYYYPVNQLQEKGLIDLEHGSTSVEMARDNYVWDYFKTSDELKKTRLQALLDCTDDMSLHPERYVAATLPVLPFQDNEFEMTLSAHFLFMYSDRLDITFHKSTILELMRVTSKEIRIFPLVNQASEASEYLDEIYDFIIKANWKYEIHDVSYEFQRNANQFLRIYREETDERST